MSRVTRTLSPSSLILLLVVSTLAARSRSECSWSPTDDLFRLIGSSTCPLPTDELSWQSAKDPGPWTHHPECTASHTDLVAGLCVFTAATHGRYGLSVVASPRDAASVAGAFTQLKTIPASKEADYMRATYEVIDIPGKAKGAVARRHIVAYESIIIDHPAVLVNKRLGELLGGASSARLRSQAVEQLADPGSVLALSTSNNSEGDRVGSILGVNSFDLELYDTQYGALYPRISRINHDCRANAFTSRTPDLFGLEVIALRDITPGEEITISYIPPGLPSSTRRAILQKWGFKCTCSLCTRPPLVTAESDLRRIKIIETTNEVDTLLVLQEDPRDEEVRRAIALTEEVLFLLEQEGLLAQFAAEQYDVLARCYKALGEEAQARWYAEMVVRDRYAGRERKEDMQELLRGKISKAVERA